MSKSVKMLLVAAMAAAISAPLAASAEELRSAECSVAIDYLFDGVLREPYQKDFAVEPGVVFEDDFSTRTRFKFFTASTSLEAGKTIVAISYFNDVGVFDFIDLRTQLTLPDNRDDETVSGTLTYFTSLGVAGERTTNYTLTCRRLKR